MNHLLESLRRLYQDGTIKEERIAALYESGKITIEEKLYILAH